MTPQQALNLLEQAVSIATQKGAYTLAEVAEILKALTTLKNTHHETENNKHP